KLRINGILVVISLGSAVHAFPAPWRRAPCSYGHGNEKLTGHERSGRWQVFCARTMRCNLTEKIMERAVIRVDDAEIRSGQALHLALTAGQVVVWQHDLLTGNCRRSGDSLNFLDLPPSSPGSDFLNVVHPDDHERVRLAILQAIDGKAPYSVECR